MLVPLTDHDHPLSAQMLDLIEESQRRDASRTTADHHPEPRLPAAPRPAWPHLAILHGDPDDRRSVRLFRAPSPAI